MKEEVICGMDLYEWLPVFALCFFSGIVLVGMVGVAFYSFDLKRRQRSHVVRAERLGWYNLNPQTPGWANHWFGSTVHGYPVAFNTDTKVSVSGYYGQSGGRVSVRFALQLIVALDQQIDITASTEQLFNTFVEQAKRRKALSATPRNQIADDDLPATIYPDANWILLCVHSDPTMSDEDFLSLVEALTYLATQISK